MKVIVVGAGIVGASIADALARGGAEPTLLDMRSPGLGATRASAGILAPYIEGYGHEAIAALGARSLALFDSFIARLVEDTGFQVEYARTGTLEVALGEADLSALHAKETWMASYGVRSEWLDNVALRTFEPTISPAAAGGLFTPAHGFVGVKGLLSTLVHRAKLSGTVVESPVEAVSVDVHHDEVEVRAGERRYVADAVVVASGSWSGRVRIANIPALPVRPVRGQLLHLGWRQDRLPQRIIWGPRCYTVPWADGSLLVGATVEDVGFDENATTAGVLALTSAVTELLPNSAGAAVDAVRVGLRPVCPDGLPVIGPYARAPRVTMATGHFRNGVLLAPLTAGIVARYVLEGVVDEAFAMTSPDRDMTQPHAGETH